MRVNLLIWCECIGQGHLEESALSSIPPHMYKRNFPLIWLPFQAIEDNDFLNPLLKYASEQLDFPNLACNVNTTGDPEYHGLLKPSVVLDVGGEKIGIVGYMTDDISPRVGEESQFFYIARIIYM